MYGVKGSVNDVPVNLWDRFYFYDNTSLKYEVPIDMNNKDITSLNNSDVNGQIDMNGNKIIGVGMELQIAMLSIKNNLII